MKLIGSILFRELSSTAESAWEVGHRSENNIYYQSTIYLGCFSRINHVNMQHCTID